MSHRLPYYRLTYKKGFGKQKTITEYRVGYAFKQLHYSILNGVPRQSTYWLSELVCSGYTDQLWEFVFQFYSMYIHVLYPNMIIDISVKFKEYVSVKRSTRPIELRNKVSIRDSLYRIIYIYCTMNKRFILSLFKDGLFKSLHLIDGLYDHLDPVNKNTIHMRSRRSFSGTQRINSSTTEEHKHLVHTSLVKIEYYFKKCKELVKGENNVPGTTGTQYRYAVYKIYELLSGLLEFGVYNFQTTKHSNDSTNACEGITHCDEKNKGSYFIWILWNHLLIHSKDTGFHLHPTIKELYKLYESNPENQSIHAYYTIVAAYRIVLNRVEYRNVFISPKKYEKYKRKFYKCFGYLEESVQNKEPRRDMKHRP